MHIKLQSNVRDARRCGKSAPASPQNSWKSIAMNGSLGEPDSEPKIPRPTSAEQSGRTGLKLLFSSAKSQCLEADFRGLHRLSGVYLVGNSAQYLKIPSGMTPKITADSKLKLDVFFPSFAVTTIIWKALHRCRSTGSSPDTCALIPKSYRTKKNTICTTAPVSPTVLATSVNRREDPCSIHFNPRLSNR